MNVFVGFLLFFAGGMCGMFVMACCAAAGAADRHKEMLP